MSWRKIAVAVVFGVLTSLGGCTQSEEPQAAAGGAMETEVVTIETANGPVRFNAEIADDPQEQARGLMFRTELADDRGMLFPFERPQRASFWMRNTVISLDLIFIGVDGRIINIAERATPYSEDQILSDGLARAVLEIRGGRSAELGIRPGDRVRHPIFPS
jgi:uncharacterized protein